MPIFPQKCTPERVPQTRLFGRSGQLIICLGLGGVLFANVLWVLASSAQWRALYLNVTHGWKTVPGQVVESRREVGAQALGSDSAGRMRLQAQAFAIVVYEYIDNGVHYRSARIHFSQPVDASSWCQCLYSQKYSKGKPVVVSVDTENSGFAALEPQHMDLIVLLQPLIFLMVIFGILLEMVGPVVHAN